MNHQHFIKRTITLAELAVKKGNHPFGALLVHDNKIILEAENTVLTDGDSTKHAELNLVSKANKIFSKEILKNSTLYTSTEPYAMCSGAIYWSNISKIIFSCSAKKLGSITNSSLVIPCNDVFKHGTRKTIIEGPILEDISPKLHESFWK